MSGLDTKQPVIKPPSEEYDDEVLYGARREATKLVELIKLGTDSECVMYPIGTFVDKQQWNLRNLTNSCKRIKTMLEGLKITHPLPLQRYCWPQMEKSAYPFVCISRESTGKTFAHLLYIVTKCIQAIPATRFDELLSKNEQVSTFKASDMKRFNDLTLHDTWNDSNNLDSINQDDFDFNSLGKKATSQEEDSEIENGQGTTNGWDDIDMDLLAEEFSVHPRYIIICSSQQQVDLVTREIERMKMSAFGWTASESNVREIPPKVRSLNVYHEDDKLSLRCSEAEIVAATPEALLRCLQLEYVDFSKAKKVVFDDLDLSLQLHNSKLREIAKKLLIQTQANNLEQASDSKGKLEACQVYLFSRKWTDMVKQFVSAVFIQRIHIFGSLIEASIYANMRFELEIYKDFRSRMTKLLNIVHLHANGVQYGKLAIICRQDSEAEKLALSLGEIGGFNIKHLPEDSAISAFKSRPTLNGRASTKLIYTLNDGALEFVAELLNDITHIIHFSLPDELILFDQRFRLMYKHINDTESNITTTLFIGPHLSANYPKELYDIVSRSCTTLKSTKLLLRDYLSDLSTSICWRWATSGLCRLDKLSKEDRLGSYCPNRHSLKTDGNENGLLSNSRWPTSGQIKITITHIVSPNEFYFWFEAHRDINSPNKKWSKIENSGQEFMSEMQKKLYRYKNTPSYSVPLERMKKGKIYGIYLPQETRVERIMLLEEPKKSVTDAVSNNGIKKNGLVNKLDLINYQLEYSNQVEVLKVDYGVRINVYLRNVIEISEELASIEAQCHRGFHLGLKPSSNEPYWLYKAKKQFYDCINVSNLHSITVWMRLNSNNCFWFENMIVSRRLVTADESSYAHIEPHRELCTFGHAESISSEPSCLPPSEQLATQSKWQLQEAAKHARRTFLRRDKIPLETYLLHVNNDLSLIVRQVDFNKQLINLEEELLEDYSKRKLVSLDYFIPEAFCLARISDYIDPVSREQHYTINRCKILCIENPSDDQDSVNMEESKFRVECMDHGDVFTVKRNDLYQADSRSLSKLPFQALTVRLAGLNPDIMKSKELRDKTKEALYRYSRDETTDELLRLMFKFNREDDVYIYVPVDEQGNYGSLIELFEKYQGLQLITSEAQKEHSELD